MKRLVYIVLVMLVLVGTMGIPLFKHTCLQDNQTFSTLFVPSDHCDEMEHEEVEKTCCGKPVKSKESVKKNCCVEINTQIVLPFYFVENTSFDGFIAPEIIDISQYFKRNIVYQGCKQIQVATNSDPPILKVNERLPRLCIWRL